MSLLDFLIWPTNETYLVLSTDYYNNAKLPLRMNDAWDMMEEVYDYDTGGHSAGQGSCAFKFLDRMLMLGGRHNKKAIARVHDCHTEILPDELPDTMAFQSCTVAEDGQTVYICGNYYDTDPTCYSMDDAYAFTPIADTSELHRMGAMSLYRGDPVIAGGVYTNVVERLVNGVWDDINMADIPVVFLYGHTMITLDNPLVGNMIDRLWIFGGVEGTIPVVDVEPTAKTWHYSDDASWVQGPDMLQPRHSHTSFYVPKIDYDTSLPYRQFRHVGGNGTFMIEDWTFSTDTSNIIDFTSLSQSDITWSEMEEYSFPTVFAVEDDYCEIIIL